MAKRRIEDWIVPIGAVCLVFIMLVPLPSPVLDLLLAVSITAGVLVLLASLYILKPVEFSVFPTLLLLLTLFRLGLNLASSRRILLHGNEGAAAAGAVIEGFGQFVVGGNYVVGFVLFLALIAIQYLVINHGAVRTAEVTARFTLDALPGKQMAIDADMNAGLIDEKEAFRRRREITREAEFYGAMDGAARFSQRDALAAVLITGINIIAGFLIGVFQLGIPFEQALKTYTILTVGDGLATMIPSLLVAVAGGMVVTRTSSDTSLGVELGKQLISSRIPVAIAAGVMFIMALIPGLPKLPFFLVAGGMALLARRAAKLERTPEAATAADASSSASAAAKAADPDQATALPMLEEMSLELGYALVQLVEQSLNKEGAAAPADAHGGLLLGRIRALRRNLASQLGFLVPPIHITDNLRLKPYEYVILLRGVEIARWEMERDALLAISSDPAAPPLEGKRTVEPAFGASATWINPALRDAVLSKGYAVIDQSSVLATHLSEIVRRYSHELLTRQETKRLLDTLAEQQPKLVEELVPKSLSLGEVQKVLKQLLREQVSIRDLPTILEALLDTAATNRNPVALVEAARQALGRGLVHAHLSESGELRLFTLNPSIEEQIQQAFAAAGDAHGGLASGGLQPSFLRKVLDGIRTLLGDQMGSSAPVLLCRSPARYHLRRLLEPFLPRVVVLSPGEIPSPVSVRSLGEIG